MFLRYAILAAIIAITSGFTACSSLQLNTNAQKVEASCATASTALKGLTALNDAGKLSPAAQQDVLKAIAIVSPICTAPTPPTLDDVKMQAFVQAVALLQARLTSG